MELGTILEKVRNSQLDIDSASAQIRAMGFTCASDIAKIDTHRKYRTGIPEAVLAEGKCIDDLVQIVRMQVKQVGRSLVTRVSDPQFEVLQDVFEQGQVTCFSHARAAVIHDGNPVESHGGVVGILSAGTADIMVAEEAKVIALEMGCEVVSAYDVGVAGIHRLLPQIEMLKEKKANAVVVAAGREGTLPTIVSGLIDVPVIGVPVSTGYGYGGHGEAALMSMLQSCSVLGVVNIDAGFVAGAFAAQIANMVADARQMP
ncbi:MAG: nickel pincer cofactor biosynthesis protein LarB [Euryarchaeota archaeon]|nr:nickel pincer cofactor biosynthesis protein LarB [Euryarchaeota archaeon]